MAWRFPQLEEAGFAILSTPHTGPKAVDGEELMPLSSTPTSC